MHINSRSPGIVCASSREVGSLTVTAQHAKEVVLYMMHAAFARDTGRYVLKVEQVLLRLHSTQGTAAPGVDEQGRGGG